MGLVFIIKFLYEMNLQCLNDIITNNLAIHIDLTDIRSWDLNTGYTAFSLTKWNGAISDNINLIDFGLTGFDNGRTDAMWKGITLTPNDTLFSMYRIGYNVVHNPTSGETTGVTVTTQYLPMSAVTTGNTGNFFELDGGYLQGFFKLKDYNYQLLPSRYNNGITIETLVYLYPESYGIFYMMGARAEDKYNPYFSGETITGTTTVGVVTSYNNFLDDIVETQVLKNSFSSPENMTKTAYYEPKPISSIANNVIAFEITSEGRLGYKYVNADGLIITNTSGAIVTNTGFTLISVAYTPYDKILDPTLIDCAKQRTGKLLFYINGRPVWIIHDFPEFYFKPFNNDKEKQIGVPYSISWGGGSFGLENSWHYDYQTYLIYKGEDSSYINSKFFVEANPISSDCYIAPTGSTYLEGLSLSADSNTFKIGDVCDPLIEYPYTVMRIEYTGTTGTSANTYFIKFNQPITAISNRNYEVDLSVFNDGFFRINDENGYIVTNKISVLVYGTVDIEIMDYVEYKYPLDESEFYKYSGYGLRPFPDRQEYQYMYDGVMYYGVTGIPVIDEYAYIYGYDITNMPINQTAKSGFVTGEGAWKPLSCTFKTKDNSGQQQVFIGLLIETTDTFNTDKPLFVSNFTYRASDILVQDERKNNLTIEQNFNTSFIGGIQKLRVYDNALTSSEILHNAMMESKKNPNLNLAVSMGGRIIYR